MRILYPALEQFPLLIPEKAPVPWIPGTAQMAVDRSDNKALEESGCTDNLLTGARRGGHSVL